MYYQPPPPPPSGNPANANRPRSPSAPSAPPADDNNLYAPPQPLQPQPSPANGSFMYTTTTNNMQQQQQYGMPTGAVGSRVSVPMYPNIAASPMQQQQQQQQPPPPLSPAYNQSFSQQLTGYPPMAQQQQQQSNRGSFTMPPPQASFGAPTPLSPAATGQRTNSVGSMLHGGYGPVTPNQSAPPMGMMPPHVRPASSPSSVVELRLKCRGLKKSDLLSESDPFVVVYLQEAAQSWREIGRTETVENSADPTFTKAFHVDFFFEEVQRLRLEVFDRDSTSEKLSEHDFLGCVELTMGQLMSAPGQSKVLALLQKDSGRNHVRGLRGHIVISAEEVSTCSDMIDVQFAGVKLDNKDGWFGASDPFLNIYRLKDETADPASPNSWVHVWKSETIMDNLNPRWRAATLSVQALCNGNLTRRLKFECMDWEQSGRHQLIGIGMMTAGELVSGERQSLDLINSERQRKKGKRYKNSGVLQVVRIECYKQHTFAEYLRGGCEISLIVGIDYTASNGAPSDPSSLHYLGRSYMGQMNDYESAISATGAILEPYDADRKFPTYGFGGMVSGAVSHCFPLTFDPSQPEVEGVSGILQAYANSFQFVSLHGPTYFAPLIHQAATIAAHFSNPATQQPQGAAAANLKYFVLLIITDGAIMDMEATVIEIVEASFLPLSIVIVGVGNADFSAMDALDCDGKLLMDSLRRTAARDIVQFVPFNQFRSNPARLAKETLAEIPLQVAQHFKAKGIKPNAPLERMGTEQFINGAANKPGMPQSLSGLQV